MKNKRFHKKLNKLGLSVLSLGAIASMFQVTPLFALSEEEGMSGKEKNTMMTESRRRFEDLIDPEKLADIVNSVKLEDVVNSEKLADIVNSVKFKDVVNSGRSEDTMTIESKEDWKRFVAEVNSGKLAGSTSVNEDEEIPGVKLIYFRSRSSGVVYQVNHENRTAEIINCIDREAKGITIPNYVKVDDISYLVKSIRNGAFAECDNLKAVEICHSDGRTEIVDKNLNTISWGLIYGFSPFTCNDLDPIWSQDDNEDSTSANEYKAVYGYIENSNKPVFFRSEFGIVYKLDSWCGVAYVIGCSDEKANIDIPPFKVNGITYKVLSMKK